MNTNEKPNAWISLIGLLLLLVGIFGVLRITINVVAFEKYPSAGIFNFTNNNYSPREEDCMSITNSFPFPVNPDGSTQKMTKEYEQIMLDQQQQQFTSCVASAVSARDQAKVNDISQSLLALFLGVGVLMVRKYIFV